MAKIEERVLTMKFDNAQFKRAAAETTGILANFKKNLKLDGVKNSLNNVARASNSSLGSITKNASRVDLSPISRSVDEVSKSFTALEAISFGALATIGGTAVTKAASGIKKLWNMATQPIIQGGMNRARNLEQANFMLSGLFSKLDDQARQSKIDQVMAAANNSVTGTAFGLDEAAKAAAQLTASQVPLEKLEGALKGIAGTASMTSSGFDEIANIFTTVAGNGRMMGQELSMLSARGLNAAASIGEYLGVTEAEVREMASEGKISFDIFSSAMNEAFGAQAARANDTYAGSLSNLRSAFGRIGADVAAVYLEKMRDLFNELRPAVNAVHKVLKPFIGLINDRFRASIDSVIRPIQTFTGALEQFNKTGTSTSTGWTTFFKLMQDIGMIASLVADVIRDAIGVMFGATPRFIEMSDTVTSAGTKIQHIFRKLLSVLMLGPEIIGHILRAVLGLSDSAGSFGGSLLDIIDHIASVLYLTAEWIRESTILQSVINLLAGGIKIVIGMVTRVAKVIGFFLGLIVKLYHAMSPVFDFILTMVSKVKNVIEEFFGILSDFRVGVINKFGKSFVEWFGRIFDAIKKFDLGELWKAIRSFKLPKIDLSQMEHLNKFVTTITGGFDKLKNFVGTIDWSPLTNIFTKMQMPNLGEISTLAASVGGGLRAGMSNISMDPLRNFASNVRTHVGNVVTFLREVDYAAIWAATTSAFKTGVRTVGEVMRDLATWIYEGVQKIDWAAVGDFLIDGLTSAVKMTVEAADSVATFISDMFSKAMEAIDWDGIVDGVLDFGDKVKDSFNDLFDSFKGKKVDTSDIEASINSIPKDVTVNVKKDLDNQTKGLRETINDFFGALFGTGPDISPEESEVISGAKGFGDSVRNIASKLSSPFATAKDTVNAEITGFGSTLKDASTSLLEGFDLVGVLNAMGLAFAGAGIFKLSESVAELAAVPTALKGALDSLGASFKSIGDAAKLEAQGNAILKIAGALAILAAAVWFLSKIPWDQMKVGLFSVLGLLGALVASVVIMDKMITDEGSEKINSLANSIIKIGIAVGIMAAAVWLLGKMDFATILQGFAASIVAIAALTAGAFFAGMTKSIAGMGAAFMGLAAGVAILAGAFLLFKLINWDEIVKGLTTLGVAVLAISIAARIADGKKLAGAGMAMLGLGTGLFALAHGLKAVAALDEEQLTKGLLVMAGVMAGITAMSRYGGNLAATATALLGVAGALIALSIGISIIAGIDFWAAAGSMIVLVGGLALLGGALHAFPKEMPAIAGSLIAIAGALAILVGAIWIIGNMEFTTVAQGFVVLAAALGGLIFALGKMNPAMAANLVPLAGGLIAISGSMLILALAMKQLEGVEWGTLGKAAAIVVGLGVAFALMGTFGAALAPGITALGTSLAILGGGLVVIAGSVWIFADAVGNLVDSLKILSENGEGIKTALGQAGEGITMFADEAESGLKKLFDIIGFTGTLKVGALAKLFDSFTSIPADIGGRLSGLTDGLKQLEEVTPTLENLKNITSGGDNGLSDFFNAFANVSPDAGANLQSLVDTLRGFDVGFFNILDGLKLLNPEEHKDNALSMFFRAFDHIKPDAGEKLQNLANTLRGFDDGFFGILERLNNLPLTEGEDNALSKFFRAFDHIDPEAGTKLQSLVNTLKMFDEGFFGTLEALANFKPTEGTGGLFNTKDNPLSKFFRAFNDVDPAAGEKLGSLVNVLKQFDISFFNTLDMLKTFDGDASKMGNFFRTLSAGVSEDLGNNLSGAVDGIRGLQEVVPELSGTINELVGLDTSGLSDVMGNIEEAFSSGIGDGISAAADAIREAVSSMLSAVQDRSGEFNTTGQDLGNQFAEGVGSADGEASSAGKGLGNAAADGAREARGRMESAGKYIAGGLAAGIRAGTADAVSAARSMANQVAAAAKVNLDIRSPSRVFMEIGQFVSQGFAIGIEKDSGLATKAIANSMDDAIKVANGKTGDLKSTTSGFYDELLKQINNNPLTKRLEVLARHSKAAHATAVKERKLEDQEKRERAEEERKKIYQDVEDAKKAIAEAKEEATTAKKETKAAEKSAEDKAKDSAKAAKDAQKQKEKITDAEERYQKAIRERDKYEYRMHGEEAGVAFVDGVAEGLMDDTEAIPSVAEILSELLLDEVETVKKKTGEYTDIFSGFDKALKTTRSMGDHIRSLTRAFKRLDNATSPRSIQRNIEKILESTVGFMSGIQDLIGVLSILEPFLPSLLNSFEASLPGIIAAVAPFAPEFAATLGGGLTSALPAILGPAGLIVGAITGIGILLTDQAGDGKILKGLEKMFQGVIKFMLNLPSKILGAIQTLFKGLKNTLRDLPRIMTTLINGIVDFIVGLVEVIPDVIPELINSIVELVVWVVLNAPALVLEIGTALIMGLVRGFDKAMQSMVGLLLAPFEWLTGRIGGKLDLFGIAVAAIQSLGRGLEAAVSAMIRLLLWPFESLFNQIGSIFGMEDLGTRIVTGFRDAIVGAMRFAVDAIAFPFIGLYNLIASIFGWEQLAFDAASSFIFGTASGIDAGADKVASSADRVTKMMNDYLKRGANNNLADIRDYIDEYMDLVSNGMVDGVRLGADATRGVADNVWRDIEEIFDMHGLGKDELKALTDAFYTGTTNPDTIVSSFNSVFDRIAEILDTNGLGGEMITDLDQSLYDAIRQGMLDQAMAEFGNVGYNSGALLTDGIVQSLGLSKGQIVAASDEVWKNIEAVFDMYGLGKSEVEALRQAYQDGTENPATFVSSFDAVFAAIESKLRLAGVGEDQIMALKHSMSTAIKDQLNPEVEKNVGETEGIFKSIFSEEQGKSLGSSIVAGIIEAITAPFKTIWDIGASFGERLISGIGSAVSGVKSVGEWLANKAIEGLTGIWNGVGGVFSHGVNFVGGLIEGIRNNIGRFAEEVKKLAKRALDVIGLGWLINSPSRKAIELSEFLVAGLTKGIVDNADDVTNAMSDMGEDVLSVARRIVDEVAAQFEEDADFTITPVVDLDGVKKGVKEIGTLTSNQSLDISSSVAGTSDLASMISGEEPTGGNVTNITNVEFNQTNTSPEPLSAYEIYTNTERGLTTLKLSGSNR